jgi:uncharacterized protein
MKVALIGATGPVGSRILTELLDRNHEVTAVVRKIDKVPSHPNVSASSADINDSDALVSAIKGHDAVISSIRFLKTDPDKFINDIKASETPRYLSVGGAASLYSPGTTDKLIDSGMIPEEYLPEPTAGTVFLTRLKQEEALNWTFLSPPMMFSNDEVFGKAEDGGRTGKFRLGLDELIVNENGDSSISYEDFAVAMVDELENPQHTRKRFTLGY